MTVYAAYLKTIKTMTYKIYECINPFKHNGKNYLFGEAIRGAEYDKLPEQFKKHFNEATR